VRPLNVDPNYVPPLALAIILGLLIFVLAKPGHGPSSVRTTLHCPDYLAATAHQGRVRLHDVRGAGTSCAQARRVFAAWFRTDLQATGPLVGGFTCGIDGSPTLAGSTGGCRRSKRVGVRFSIRFKQER
jgi:hypothetical protein